MDNLNKLKKIPKEIIDSYAKDYCRPFDLERVADDEGGISVDVMGQEFPQLNLDTLYDIISENMLADLKTLQSEVLKLYWDHSRTLDGLGQRASQALKRGGDQSEILEETDVSMNGLLAGSLDLHNRFDKIRYYLAILQDGDGGERTSEVKVLAGSKIDLSQIETDFAHLQKIIIEHEDLRRQLYIEHVFSLPQIDSLVDTYEDVFTKSKDLADTLFELLGVGFTFYVKADDDLFESFYAYGRRPDDNLLPIDLREDGAIHRVIKNTFSLSETPASSVELGVFIKTEDIEALSSGSDGDYLSGAADVDEAIERALAYELGSFESASIEAYSQEVASYLERYDRNLSKVPPSFNLNCFLNINLWCADNVDTAGDDFILYFTKLVEAIHDEIQGRADDGRGSIDQEKFKRLTGLIRFANADEQVKSLYDLILKRLKFMIPITQFSPTKLDAYAEALGKIPKIKWQSAIIEPRGREVIGGIQCIDETGKWNFNPLVVMTGEGHRIEMETYNFLKGLQVLFSPFIDKVYQLGSKK